MKLFFRFILVSFLLITSACSYQGNDSNLFERKLSWYSYLNGDDIQANCSIGSSDHMRMIYNAVRSEQVRTYDINTQREDAAGDLGTRMKSRVLKPANLPDMGFGSLHDFLTPWRGEEATVWLRDSDLALLWSALANSLAFEPAPRGLHMDGEDFFWVISLCKEGVFSFNAWKWPSDSFKALSFDELLFAWDMNETPVNPPREIPKGSIHDGSDDPARIRARRYRLSIGENGLQKLFEE
jgi:hypothetical protein